MTIILLSTIISIERKTSMQHKSVAKLFDEQIEHYSQDIISAKTSPVISLCLRWIKKKKIKRRIKICEFGGGAGQLLSKIEEKYKNAQFTNVELVGKYRNYLKSRNILFVKGSVLNSKLKDNSYNVVIVRDVLHHLVGKSYRQSKLNQIRALNELQRIVKPGGAVFIDELVHGWPITSKIIYKLSVLNSFIGIRMPFFQITPHAVIAFMTPQEILSICSEIFGVNNIRHNYVPDNTSLRFRLVHLGAQVGKMIIVCEKTEQKL